MTKHDGVHSGAAGYESEIAGLRRQLAESRAELEELRKRSLLRRQEREAKAKALDALEAVVQKRKGVQIMLWRDGSYEAWTDRGLPNVDLSGQGTTLLLAIVTLAARLQEADG